jgi:phosphate-selective porin OprO/OprP
MFDRKESASLLAIPVVLLCASSTPAVDMEGEWKEGLRFVSEDKSVEVSVGGFFQNDWTFQKAEDELRAAVGEEFPDGTEFRRARLNVAGLYEETTEFKAEYEFAKGEAGLRDVYVGLRKLPVLGGVRIGHYKEPFGLEQLTSDRYQLFLERSIADVFAPARNTGIMIHDSRSRATWAAGFFREADGFGNGSGGGDSHGTARVTFIPWQGAEEEGTHLLHLGVAGSLRNPPGDEITIAARPETNLAPRIVSTGAIDATEEVLLGGEVAFIWGPASVQGEVMQASFEADAAGDPSLMGSYVSAGWLLTGEHRAYSRKNGTFDRVRPNSSFRGPGSGAGAWEVIARWSRLDLNDENVLGGELQDLSAGLNWYLNPNFRLMTNYVHGDLEDVGTYDGFSARFQSDF